MKFGKILKSVGMGVLDGATMGVAGNVKRAVEDEITEKGSPNIIRVLTSVVAGAVVIYVVYLSSSGGMENEMMLKVLKVVQSIFG